jgi:hypothetical protein
MTRPEFITEYLKREGLPDSCRTVTGFRTREFERIALPCACGAPECTGWAMVPPADVYLHEKVFGNMLGLVS